MRATSFFSSSRVSIRMRRSAPGASSRSRSHTQAPGGHSVRIGTATVAETVCCMGDTRDGGKILPPLVNSPAQITEGGDWHLLPVPGWDRGGCKTDLVLIERRALRIQ